MRNKLILFIGIILSIILYISTFSIGIIKYSDLKIYDNLKTIPDKLFSKKYTSSVVIIDIDEKSLQYLGQWPWSRLLLSELVNIISKNYPSNIGIDVLFAEYDKTSPSRIIDFYKNFLSKDIKIKGLSKNLLDNDLIFAKQISNTKTVLPVYLSSKIIGKQNCYLNINNLEIKNESHINLYSQDILCNIKELQKAAYNVGFMNSKSDEDGIFRRVPLFINHKNKIIPSFALANLMSVDTVKLNRDTISIFNKQIKMGENSNVLLNFNNHSKIKQISAIDILTGNFDESSLKGKFVLIGASAIGLHDHYKLVGDKIINGIKIHSVLINNILNHDLSYELKKFQYLNLIISLILAILTFFIFIFQKFEKLIFVLLFILWLFSLNIYLLSKGLYFSFGYFIIPFIIEFFLLNIYLIFSYYANKKKFHNDLLKANSSAIASMIAIIESRDVETGEHIKRTKEYATCLSNHLYKNNLFPDIINKEFIELIYRASPLHDIGKVAIPDEILKKTDKLTEEEYQIIQTHVEVGKNIIENTIKEYGENKFLKMAYNIIYYHHEKWDGTGYPNKIKGEDIPLAGRIMAICDVYDALINKRYYKEAYDYEYSEELIMALKEKSFDPVLIDAFKEIKEEFKKIALKYKD